MKKPTGCLRAFACVVGGEKVPSLSGVVKLYETGCGVLLEADIFGLPQKDGIYGFHIHEGDSCGGEEFSDTKGHYNPAGKEHPYHAGDLPPLFSCNGRAYMKVLTDRFCVADVLGRTVVIHSHPDDFHTQPSGDSGEKIACGVIRPCCTHR